MSEYKKGDLVIVKEIKPNVNGVITSGYDKYINEIFIITEITSNEYTPYTIKVYSNKYKYAHFRPDELIPFVSVIKTKKIGSQCAK